MSTYKIKILLLMIIASKITLSGLARHDINWSDYEEFGMNNGKYEAGRKGIIVYKKDGNVSGEIDQPMPNFDGVPNGAGGGGAGMWDDPQIITTVTHILNPKGKRADIGYNFLGRHLRKDVNLYKNYKSNINGNNKKRENEINKFSEVAKTKHHIDIGGDFSFIRINKVLHDAITYETLSYEDYKKKVKINDLIARMGSGSNSVYTADGKFVEVADPFRVAGGLNKLTNKYTNNGVENVLNLYLERVAKTAIDIGTMGGDSGSPVFWWDKDENKWKVIANNSAGISSRGEKGSVLLNGVQHIEKFKERVTDKEITNPATVTFNNGNLIVDNADTRTFDKSDFENKLMVNHITKNNTEINDSFFKVKNQVFNKEGLIIELVGNTDTSIARLDFKKDATIQGSGTLKTAGIVVDKGATLTYKSNIEMGNTVRKIGEGALKIEGNSQNEGDINIGGNGTLLLNNSGGYAAKNIRLAQGADVKLIGDNQLNGNNIYFGLRGGRLDLNGKNLTFKDIYHVDKGAKISNTNDREKSIFTFNPDDNEERTYLGGFTKNLDVIYNPSTSNAKWNLRGNSEILGKFNIEKGTVSIGGDVIVHGYDNVVGKDEYSRITFKSNEINVKSNLEINRAVEIDSKINIENGAKLNIQANGNVIEDMEQPYRDAPTEKEINKIVLKNEINFKNPSIPTANNLILNTANNNEVSIESKISGNIKAEKIGDGLVEIKSSDENNTSGKLDIKAGKLKLAKDNSLKNVEFKIENHSILEVDSISTLSNILPKIDKNANGVLSLGNDVATIAPEYKNYSSLFLGSSKNIILGTENTMIDASITRLNLGGDNGTITLKGLDVSNHIRDINIGDGVNKGKVVIDKIAENNNFNLNINKGIDLEITENKSSSKLITLGYGSYTSFKNKSLIKGESEGVLLLNENDNSNNIVINDSKVYIGAHKDKEITLNSLNTGDQEYRISGDGKLNIAFNLEKNLTVDAQYLDGGETGEINVKTSNPNYIGTVTVMGNKNGENKGSTNLKLDAENSLGTGNVFNIKSGGNLNLNGHNLTLKIGETDKYGSISNKALDAHSTLKIIADNKTVVNNKILGNASEIEKSSDIDIVKVGNNSIEFTNSENNFKKLLIESGTLIYKNENSLRDTEIKLNSGTKLDATTTEISSHIIADNADIKINNNKSSTGNTIVKELTLKSDITISGDRPKPKTSITYRKMNIGEHNLILSTQTMRFGEIVKTEGKKGTVTLANSSIGFLTGDKNKTLNEALSKLVIAYSQLMLRDYKSNISDRNDKNHTLVEIIGFSSIKNGWYNDRDLNGGGGGANFNNPLLINEGSSLTFENNSLFGNSFTIDSNINGSGKIYLTANNTQYNSSRNANFKITSNFKDFRGVLEVTGKDKNNKEHIFQIDDENEEDRTISYKIINQGKFKNMSSRNVIFKDLSEFTGDLKAENGGIVLSGQNGINTSATINLINDKDLTLHSDDEVMVDKNLRINITDKTDDPRFSKIIKNGSGKVHLGDQVNINNAKNATVETGELSLTKDILVADSNYVVNDNAKLTFDLNKDTRINSLISGEGNLEHKGSKLTIDSTKLKNSGELILNDELELNVINEENTEKTNLLSSLKGREESKLTLINANNTLEINKDISEFKGTLNLKKANLSLNIENGVVNGKVEGVSELKNTNITTLTLKDISKFSGNVLAENGDLKLEGEKSLISAAKIKLNNGKNVILNTEKDIETSNLNIDIAENSSNNSKIIKNGSGKLHLGDQVNINNAKNATVETGELSLTKDILVADSNYVVNDNAKLTFDLNKDTRINSLISGEGNLEHKGSKLTIDSTKLKNSGELILNDELELNVINDENSEKTNLLSSLKGREESKLTLLNANNTLEINKDISEFKGTLNLKEANLSLNIENGVVNGKVEGRSVLKNTNITELTVNNIKDFEGTIEAENGDIKLNITDKPAISKYLLTGANIKINTENSIDLSGKVFKNLTEKNYLEKTGTGTLSLNPETLQDIKNVNINEGTLSINGNNSENKIKAGVNLFRKASLDIVDGTYLQTLKNASVINLVDKNFKVENYETVDEGRFDITLTEMNKKVLEVENASTDINAKLFIEPKMVEAIKNGGEKLVVAKLNTNLNLINLEEDYETLYGLYAEKETNKVEIVSKVSPKTFNSLFIFNELNLLNASFNRSKFRNSFEVNHIESTKKDTNFIKFDNTKYRNRLSSKGSEWDLELIKTFNTGLLSFGANYKEIKTNIDSEILVNNNIFLTSNKLLSRTIVPRLGYKYKNYEISAELGYNTVYLLKDGRKRKYADFLKNQVSLSINPEYKISENLTLKYLNTFGYSYTPMLNEYVSERGGSAEVVKNKRPFSFFYETGTELRTKYVDFHLKGDILYNLSRIKLRNKDEEIENMYKDKYRLGIGTGLIIKPVESLAIKADFMWKINQKAYSNHNFKLGLEYRW